MAVRPKDEQRIPFSFNELMIEFLISSDATSMMIMFVTTGVTFFTHSNSISAFSSVFAF